MGRSSGAARRVWGSTSCHWCPAGHDGLARGGPIMPNHIMRHTTPRVNNRLMWRSWLDSSDLNPLL